MRLAFLLLLLISGCVNVDRTGVTVREADSVFPQVILWNKEMLIMDRQKDWWLTEAKKRFVNPVVLICHGGYQSSVLTDSKVWYLFPDSPRAPIPTSVAAAMLANIYPNRDIVLVSCNAKGNREDVGVLYTPRVWYVPDGVVWMEPDFRGPLAKWYRGFWDGKGYGSIWDFVSYDGRRPPTTSPTTKP